VALHSEYFGRPWSCAGYEGFAVAHVQYGVRSDGCILRLGGDAAHSHWQRVFQLARSVTRLDVEATFRVNRDVPQVIHSHYKQLLKHSRGMKRGPAVSMLVKSDGSRTVYSGRRASNRFGRIYDKGRESGLKQFEGCVRYEMETKGKAAYHHARAVSSSNNPDGQAGRLACRFFSDRATCFGTLTKVFSQLTFLNVARVSVSLTDVDRKIEWLRRSVRGTLEQCIENRGFERVFSEIGLRPSLRFSIEEGGPS